MSFFDTLSAFLPLRKKVTEIEYFFAINIGVEKLTAALWAIENKELKILDIASSDYSSKDEITGISDKLLDQVLGLKEIEPQKILFGVPDSWLVDDSLKEENLKLLRSLVKALELTPMAYVAISHSLVHFLEKQKSIPTTAILVGFDSHHLSVMVVRAGKLDGVKVVEREKSCELDIEKTLLSFTSIETLPSKILIYGEGAQDLKTQLLSFSWMSNLSFLHFPKIEVLEEDIEIKSVCLAGASELNKEISYTEKEPQRKLEKKEEILKDSKIDGDYPLENSKIEKQKEKVSEGGSEDQNFGFIVGDVSSLSKEKISEETFVEEKPDLPTYDKEVVETSDFEQEEPSLAAGETAMKVNEEKTPQPKPRFFDPRLFIPKKFSRFSIPLVIALSATLLLGGYIFLPKANVKIFVEPKVLEKDAQVVADPGLKTVDEEAKLIPAQIVETEVSGSDKDSASGKKQIGDPAKGTIVIYNKTFDQQVLSKGTKIQGTGGIKFALDSSVTIASQSASDSGIAFGKSNTTVTAAEIGADGNLPSGTEITVSGFSTDKLAAKAEGNFSGGTSKDVTVVSSEDIQRLLAKLTSQLRQQAQQKLQEKYPDKKILQEALLEQIISKKYSKNVNDQAGDFSLTETINFKGTAFEDKDLKLIVSKLVNTEVPDGFILDLSQTETQADVSKLEKDGKLIFLARFKAKLLPKIDVSKIASQIVFKTPEQVSEILKGMDNILSSEIVLSPNLPKALQRLPLFSKNIKIEVGLK